MLVYISQMVVWCVCVLYNIVNHSLKMHIHVHTYIPIPVCSALHIGIA